MSIWTKLFGKKEVIESEPKIVIVRLPHERYKPAIPSFSDMNEEQLKLAECFYVTLVPREGRPGKKRHLQDGWRHGVSHPFHYKGKEYDMGYNRDQSYKLFQRLIQRLGMEAK
jgi:hypothetical protein